MNKEFYENKEVFLSDQSLKKTIFDHIEQNEGFFQHEF